MFYTATVHRSRTKLQFTIKAPSLSAAKQAAEAYAAICRPAGFEVSSVFKTPFYVRVKGDDIQVRDFVEERWETVGSVSKATT